MGVPVHQVKEFPHASVSVLISTPPYLAWLCSITTHGRRREVAHHAGPSMAFINHDNVKSPGVARLSRPAVRYNRAKPGKVGPEC